MQQTIHAGMWSDTCTYSIVVCMYTALLCVCIQHCCVYVYSRHQQQHYVLSKRKEQAKGEQQLIWASYTLDARRATAKANHMGIDACHKTKSVMQDILHDVRGEIGVSSSSVASGHHLDHRHDLTREADLGEAHALGQRPHLLLMLWKQEGVLQHHCQTGDAIV